MPKLIHKFPFQKFYIENAPGSGRQIETEEGKIKALIYANWRKTTERLTASNLIVYDHVKRLGLISLTSVILFLKSQVNNAFLKRIITLVEK